MSFIDYSAREIYCKLVYCGPELCGKTSNLQFIYSKTRPPETRPPELEGEMVSPASEVTSHTTETKRTQFFDFLPLSLGDIRGFKTRLHLYTLPGSVFRDTRRLILDGIDGVSFVADSRLERMEANTENLESLRASLEEIGYDLDALPHCLQYNKRDLPSAVPVDELSDVLNPRRVPEFEACAVSGEGVFDTLKALARQVLTELRKGSG
ncbi:GTPase domain-containing protein [Pseudenhygromyxa sp. WMMC2535]|uniref:GTP-binding protein n=1 Tax=Pseudenhygromyxa sp. WMMC2535 TaxID=2712867 RepID=UPI001557C38F|nr:GTPase domain-containing protein [Pseudenhygromyxa sp. WMMC2535]NVB38083.1 GTPase domain-containing protein [Pseudenhygromyxa sp. WMMC2535]